MSLGAFLSALWDVTVNASGLFLFGWLVWRLKAAIETARATN